MRSGRPLLPFPASATSLQAVLHDLAGCCWLLLVDDVTLFLRLLFFSLFPPWGARARQRQKSLAETKDVFRSWVVADGRRTFRNHSSLGFGTWNPATGERDETRRDEQIQFGPGGWVEVGGCLLHRSKYGGSTITTPCLSCCGELDGRGRRTLIISPRQGNLERNL